MLLSVDTKNAFAVATHVGEILRRSHPGHQPTLIERVAPRVIDMFMGNHPDFHPVDLAYHDLEHTMQASLCMAQILDGNCRSPDGWPLTARQFELGVVAALLHDVGYLKSRSDTEGTGAKYTYCHVLRSAAFAASYLPSVGVEEGEISGVLGAINCTGQAKQIGRLHFRDDTERFIGCALATADYLGQMAAPDYPDDLEILYLEFCESDDYAHVPQDRRIFRSAADLQARTPEFWRKLVLPKLTNDFQAVYRFLTQPGGANPYLDAVARNIAIIEARAAASTSALV